MTVLAIDPGVSGAVVLLGAHIIECRRDFKHASEIDQAIHELAARADVKAAEATARATAPAMSQLMRGKYVNWIMAGAANRLTKLD